MKKTKAVTPKTKSLGGRKEKYAEYVEPHLDKIKAWKAKGATDEKIAEKLNVAYSSFRDYKKAYTALAAALKNGLDESVAAVEGALFKRAVGFEYTERKTIESGDEIRTETTVKQMAPDVGAIVFYLKNRLPEEWKDKTEVEGSPLHGLSDADIVARLVGIVKAASARA